jgi:hypothetical protein
MHREALFYLKAYFKINVGSFVILVHRVHYPTGRYVEVEKSSLNKRRNNNNPHIDRCAVPLIKLRNRR